MRIGMVMRPRGAPELEALRERVEALRTSGHEVWPHLTFESGDGVREAEGVARAGADLVLAVGGDGTVNEVVNGVLRAGWRGRLGVVPNGTANDFAAGLEIPEDLDAALEVALEGRDREVDIGCVNGRYFVNVSTGGFGATATEEASSEAKRLLGPLAYLVTGVRMFADLRPSRVRFTSAEGLAYDGDVMLFAVGNARRTGGGNLLTPRAELDDGRLDVVIVAGVSRMDLLTLLPDLRSGRHLEDPAVTYFQTERLVVESDADLSVNADGEPMEGSRFEYTLADRRLRVRVP